MVCPVRSFFRYYTYLTTAPHWVERSRLNRWKQPSSVWRSTVYSSELKEHHPQVVPGTLSTDAKSILNSCGITMQSKSIRGAIASFLVEMGMSQAAIMSRGAWLSSAVFQRYYCRVGKSVNFTDITTATSKMNSQLPIHHQNSEALQDLDRAAEMVSSNEVIQGCDLTSIDILCKTLNTLNKKSPT